MKNNIYFIYLLLLAVLPVHSRNTSLFSVYEITCEQQIEPSGIGSKSPRILCFYPSHFMSLTFS